MIPHKKEFFRFSLRRAEKNVEISPCRNDELHRSYTNKAIDILFDLPVLETSNFIRKSGIPKQTALRIVRALREHCVLEEVQGRRGRTPAILTFNKFLDIAGRY
jgi:hypothetical protein